MGVFAEFERDMIEERMRADIARVKSQVILSSDRKTQMP